MLRKCGQNRPGQLAETKTLVEWEPGRARREFFRARQALGWSQAKAADFVGVSLTTIWRWELGEQRIDADALIAISIRAFGVVDIRPLERTGT